MYVTLCLSVKFERSFKKKKEKYCRIKINAYLCTRIRDDAQDDSLAQPVEHIPFKDGVLGSNPRRITKIIVNGFRVVDDFFRDIQ